MEQLLSIYILNKELEKEVNLAKYYTYHLGRCKQTKDIVKLTFLNTGALFAVARITEILNQQISNTINNLTTNYINIS